MTNDKPDTNDQEPRGFVDDLLASALRLEQYLFGPDFPNLSNAPESDSDVQGIIRAANAWSMNVMKLYGHGQRERHLPSQRKRTDPGVTTFFPSTARVGGGFGTPEYQIGSLPPELRDSQCDIFGVLLSKYHERGSSAAGCFRDPALRGIEFTVSNWPQIESLLGQGRTIVIRRSLELIEWVHSRVRTLKRGTIPRLTAIREADHNRLEVEVEVVGRKRLAVIPDSQARFLRELAQRGTSTTLRRTKLELLQVIPELRSWILNMPREEGADDANEATYGVEPEVQENIQLDIL